MRNGTGTGFWPISNAAPRRSVLHWHLSLTAPGGQAHAPERHPHRPQLAQVKRTTDSDHAFNIAPNLLQQDFSASAPNQKWAGDITYVWTREGWVYLAVILDLFSRRVIGWAISNRMKQDLAIRALNMAVALRRPPSGCLHHTDRGSQYCAHDYQKILRQHGFRVSMARDKQDEIPRQSG